MNDDTIHSAQIIDLFQKTVDHRHKIHKVMNRGSFIHDKMKAKLIKRMEHCKKVLRQFASQDSQSYTFNITHTDNPMSKDFLNHWNQGRHSMFYNVDLSI